MSKYIPPEKMTEDQIRAELDGAFSRWNALAGGACSDPSWPDGINMNLVRNHIIFWYGWLEKKISAPSQLSLFDEYSALQNERAIPPEVPNNYVVRDGQYPNRLNGRYSDDEIVWGYKGEYIA